MADALINSFKPVLGKKHPIAEVVLIPSGEGRFEVEVNGELVYSKAATGKHTTNEFIVDEVRKRLS